MLQLVVGESEYYDEESSRFIMRPGGTLQLEHSLISLAKWESYYKKPFLSQDNLSNDELRYYIQCMCLQPTDPSIIQGLTQTEINQVAAYIQDNHSATTVNQPQNNGYHQVITSELIYSWMIAHGVWLDCEKWHLGRLLKLLEVRAAQSSPPKKMSASEMARRSRELNAARRSALGSRG